MPIYLDNNATTREHPRCAKRRREFECFANPSSTSKEGTRARNCISRARTAIARALKVDPSRFDIVFTSGASESNATAIGSAVDAHCKKHRSRPHVVSTAVEHKSVLEKLRTLEETRRATHTLVQPDSSGTVHPRDVAKAVRDNTVLVAVIGANNELGTINNIKAIVRAVRRTNSEALVHVDGVQMFGKIPPPGLLGADSFSASFHKLHGPKGLGVLVMRKNTGFVPQICGTQEDGLRGGTENVPAIVSAREALGLAMRGREKKNQRLLRMSCEFLRVLDLFVVYADSRSWDEVLDCCSHLKRAVVLGPKDNSKRLPHTLLFSILPEQGCRKEMCNVEFRKMLDKRGVVVSISSACLSSSDKASHVLRAIGAPTEIKRGVIRVSFSDHNTMKDARDAARIFNDLILDFFSPV